MHENLPDLVLLDVVMPGLDGYQTCAALRNIADYNKLPILILTGLDDMDSIDKAFQSGATDFITKPLNWPLLSQRVRYALRTRDLFSELSTSQQKLSKAQSIAKLGYWEYDPVNDKIRMANETVTLLGIEKYIFPLDEFLERLGKDDAVKMRQSIKTTLENSAPYTLDHLFKTDVGIDLSLTQHAELSNIKGEKLIIGTFQDITERVEAERKIYFHQYFDSETSLPNREHFQMLLNKIIDNTSKDHLFGVMSITFDKLRSIGSTIGSDFISQFIKTASHKILDNVDGIKELSRLSNNSVGILSTAFHRIDEIEKIGKSLIELFRQPLEINDENYHTTLSIGITIFPYESDAYKLFNNAVTAQIKCIAEGGSKFLFYHQDMDRQATEIIALEDKMRKAVANNEFHAYFQPQIRTEDDSIIGMEALARWFQADDQMIFPDRFIPLAEETELILDIGKHILLQACKFSRALSDKLGCDIRAGVNLSALQFADRHLLDYIREAIETTHISPQNLEIEITESIAMTDISHAVNTLSKIRDMGIKTSMDDFGTGYSSLSYLQKLPLDTLKIDQSFIRPIGPAGKTVKLLKQ